IADYVKHADFTPLPSGPTSEAQAEFERLRSSKGKTRPGALRQELRQLMMDYVSVFRTEETMQTALDRLQEIRHIYQTDLTIDDRGQKYNTDLLEAWELGSLIDLAEVTTVSALNR